MNLRKENVEPVIVRVYCEHCDNELSKTGRVFYSSPLQYEYTCVNVNCSEYGIPFTSTKCYPSIRFIDENGVDVGDAS